MSVAGPAPRPRVGGAQVVGLRARPGRVLRMLVALGPAYAALFGPPAAAAALEGETLLALATAAPAGLALAAWAVGVLWMAPPQDLRGVEALALVALAFSLACALAAPAFLALGMAPVDAGFEAVSAITTTGLTVATGAADWPVSGHFLRAWLQWVAGLAFVAGALALIVGPGVVARRLAAAGMNGDGDWLTSTRGRARGMLAVYVALTLLGGAGAAALASTPLEGALLTLTAAATGGFSPDAGSLAGEGRALQAVIMTVCVLGAVSFPMMLAALRGGGLTRLWRDPALRLMACLLAGGVAVVALAGDWRAAATWADAAVMASSALSTAGFSSVDAGAMPAAALAALTALMVVGGDVGSTAGGLKATRLVVALAALRLTVARTRTPPGAVTHLRAMDQRFHTDELAAIAALTLVYAGCAFALWLGFLLADVPALPALFDTVSALSTVGLSAGAITAETPAWLKAGAMAAMLLGRVEFFALIALFSPHVWIGGGR